MGRSATSQYFIKTLWGSDGRSQHDGLRILPPNLIKTALVKYEEQAPVCGSCDKIGISGGCGANCEIFLKRGCKQVVLDKWNEVIVEVVAPKGTPLIVERAKKEAMRVADKWGASSWTHAIETGKRRLSFMFTTGDYQHQRWMCNTFGAREYDLYVSKSCYLLAIRAATYLESSDALSGESVQGAIMGAMRYVEENTLGGLPVLCTKNKDASYVDVFFIGAG
jgi:hypothetical protein